MASEKELKQLRLRVGHVLKSPECLEIRFKMGDILIQRFMYTYIAQAIMDDTVHLDIDDGNGYDHECNTITYDSLDVGPAAIVHEATHALINATNVGKTITKGMHEAAAYLAEALWALNAGRDVSVDVPHMDRPLRRLARSIQEFNPSNVSGSYVCPPAEVAYLQAVLASSALGMEINRADRQPGIGDGPSGPLKKRACAASR
jgi:hypothetical protein